MTGSYLFPGARSRAPLVGSFQGNSGPRRPYSARNEGGHHAEACREVLPGSLLLLAVSHAGAAAEDAGEALRRAASAGDLAKVKELLDAGADVNAANAYGGTALSFAVDRGHTAVVDLLLERGADVNVKDRFYGARPLDWAAGDGYAEIVRALLAKGAQGEAEALTAAAGAGHGAVVKVILDRGKLGPEALSDALVIATQGQKAEVVALLQVAGAKPPTVAVDPAILKTYEGTYDGESFSLTIAAKDGKLILTSDGEALTFAAADPVTFGAEEAPGLKVVFQVEEGEGARLDHPPWRAHDAAEEEGDTMRTVRLALPLAALFCLLPGPAGAKPVSWPSFRGTQAAGVAEGAAPTAWDAEKGTNVLWKTPIPGLAHSGPVVWGDRIRHHCRLRQADDSLRVGLDGDVDSVESTASYSWRVLALDRKTGKVLWDQVAPAECRGEETPEGDARQCHSGDRRHSSGRFFGAEGLYCYDLDGKHLEAGPGHARQRLVLRPRLPVGVRQLAGRVEGSGDRSVRPGEGLVHRRLRLATGNSLAHRARRDPSWGYARPSSRAKTRAELVTNGTKHVRGYDPMTGQGAVAPDR